MLTSHICFPIHLLSYLYFFFFGWMLVNWLHWIESWSLIHVAFIKIYFYQNHHHNMFSFTCLDDTLKSCYLFGFRNFAFNLEIAFGSIQTPVWLPLLSLIIHLWIWWSMGFWLNFSTFILLESLSCVLWSKACICFQGRSIIKFWVSLFIICSL